MTFLRKFLKTHAKAERERERERKCVCMCIYMRECIHIYMYVGARCVLCVRVLKQIFILIIDNNERNFFFTGI